MSDSGGRDRRDAWDGGAASCLISVDYTGAIVPGCGSVRQQVTNSVPRLDVSSTDVQSLSNPGLVVCHRVFGFAAPESRALRDVMRRQEQHPGVNCHEPVTHTSAATHAKR